MTRLVDAEQQAHRLAEVDLGPRPSARAVIRRTVTRSTADLLAALPNVELDDDPEAVHRARVALRRLRSDVRTFDEFLIAGRLDPVIDDLRRLGRALGAVRDLDVLDEQLRGAVDELDDASAGAALDDLFAVLRTRRRRAHRSLVSVLGDRRTRLLVDRLLDLADDPPTSARALGRASRRLRRPVRRRWRRLRRVVEELPPEPSRDDLHRVRIHAKRARYAAETAAPVLGRPMRRYATAAAALQSRLGDLRDAELAGDWLREVSAEVDPAGAFAAGRIAQLLHDRADSLRAGWMVDFDRVRARADRASLD